MPPKKTTAGSAPAKTSWRTSSFSIAGLISAVSALVIDPLLDADPLTIPNWREAVPLILIGIGLWFSRDDAVSSKQRGIE